jgi:hypothetical protein
VGGGENGGAGEREDAGLGVGRADTQEEGEKEVGEKNWGEKEEREWGCGPAGGHASPPFLTWDAHARYYLVTCGNVPREQIMTWHIATSPNGKKKSSQHELHAFL